MCIRDRYWRGTGEVWYWRGVVPARYGTGEVRYWRGTGEVPARCGTGEVWYWRVYFLGHSRAFCAE
eukprot:4264896-Alexandrium_andersonii.AAC.1